MKQKLLLELRNGSVPAGERLPGERILAEKYGVSYMTARKVISELVEAGILFRRPRSGVFLAKDFLRIQLQGWRTIAFLTLEFSGMSSRIFTFLEQRARHRGFALLACSSVQDVGLERKQLEMLLKSNVAGVVFAPIAGDCNADLLRQLTEAGIPVVTIDQPSGDENVSSCACDNFQCACLATRHLIEKGHKNIVHLTVSQDNFQNNQVAQQRYAGFLHAKREAGLPEMKHDLVHLPYRYTYLPMSDITLDDLGYQETFRLLCQTERPTAIVAAFDELAFGIYQAARALHLEIPRDLSVVGINDSEFCPLCVPPLTSVRQPIQAMVNHAVDYLAECIDGPGSENILHKTFPGTLILRRSTDAAKE